MDPVDHFHFPDGSSFSVSADFDEYIDELKATFPHERWRSTSFFAMRATAYLYGLLYYFRGREHERFGALPHLTLQRGARARFQGPQAAAAAVGRLRALGLAAVAHLVRLRLDAAPVVFPRQLLSGGRIAGRSPTISRGSCRSTAATFLMRSMVERIVVETDAAVGVEIATGLGSGPPTVRVDATHIVSNADLMLTLERMLGPSVVGEQEIAAVNRLRATNPCFLVHLGLATPPWPTRAGRRLSLALVERERSRRRRVQDFYSDDVRAEDGAARRADHHLAAGSRGRLRTDRGLAKSTSRRSKTICWRGSKPRSPA